MSNDCICHPANRNGKDEVAEKNVSDVSQWNQLITKV